MASANNSTPTPALRARQAQLAEYALDTVLDCLASALKPKARKAARAKLEAYADRLETWQGYRYPANVIPIRGPRGVEQDRAIEEQRQSRAYEAAAIRVLIGRAFKSPSGGSSRCIRSKQPIVGA